MCLSICTNKSMCVCVFEREADVGFNGWDRKSSQMPRPWEEAWRDHLAVNLPGPQGPAGAQEVSLTSCREKSFDDTPLLWATVNLLPERQGIQESRDGYSVVSVTCALNSTAQLIHVSVSVSLWLPGRRPRCLFVLIHWVPDLTDTVGFFHSTFLPPYTFY